MRDVVTTYHIFSTVECTQFHRLQRKTKHNYNSINCYFFFFFEIYKSSDITSITGYSLKINQISNME